MASNKHLSAEGRQDFMKRFYAVAVSVGFASKIGDLKFLSDFAVPSYQQLHQLILLIFAMVVVVGSWDAYFQSIKKKPLIDLRRFALDVFIVSLYILLLLSVKNTDVFLFYLTFIMLSYAFWDLFDLKVHPESCGSSMPSDEQTYISVRCYAKTIFKSGVWFVIFLAILVSHHFRQPNDFYFSVLTGCAVYILYRVDKAEKFRFAKLSAFGLVVIFGVYMWRQYLLMRVT